MPSSKNVAIKHKRAIVGRTLLPFLWICQNRCNFIVYLESEIFFDDFDDVEIEVNVWEFLYRSSRI